MTKPSEELRSAMPEETKRMNGTFTNGLSMAQVERLAILVEELGEAQHCVGKILRHGYGSRNPLVSESLTNRSELVIELGDIVFAINQLTAAHDVDGGMVGKRVVEKAEKIKPYLHYQEVTNGD